MEWVEQGKHYTRDFTTKGTLGDYCIDLDQPPIDRWAIFLNGRRIVENVYYLTDAKRIAANFDVTGILSIPTDLRPNKYGDIPRLLLDGITQPSQMPTAPTLHGTLGSTTSKPRNVFSDADRLVEAIRRFKIEPDRQSIVWSPWKSGLYCLLDAVFSAQSKYATIVVPLLKRLNLRSGMSDSTERTFSDYVVDVDGIGPEKFERYASGVLNRQQVGGRLKVQVAYDAARFLAGNGVETMADLQSNATLDELILTGMRQSVVGIGPALSNYFMGIIGYEDYVKVDVMIIRFLARVDIGPVNPMNAEDYEYASKIIVRAAYLLDTTPARLDKAIWSFESTQATVQ